MRSLHNTFHFDRRMSYSSLGSTKCDGSCRNLTKKVLLHIEDEILSTSVKVYKVDAMA